MMLFKRAKNRSAESASDSREKGHRRFAAGCGLRLTAVFFALIAIVYATGLLINLGAGRIKGMNVASELVPVNPENLSMLFDLTGVDEQGERVAEQVIFDALLDMIGEAESEIVLDLFLVNRFNGDGRVPFYRDLTGELVQALVDRKRSHPELFILFITDPINSGYKTVCPPDLIPVKEVGGHVVLTDLHQLPDSNYLYSPVYRVLRHLGTVMAPVIDLRFLPNPFDLEADKFTLRQFARLLNFKANHRKVAAVRGDDGTWQAMITSANPHSASSAHGNQALRLNNDGPIRDIVFSEYHLARASLLQRPQLYFGPWSASDLVRDLERRVRDWSFTPVPYEGEDKAVVQYLSEREVGARLDRLLESVEAGDRIELMMFYLADPRVVGGLQAAIERGARARLLLDPNKDAFGRQKHGVPNRVIAARLVQWAAENENRDLRLRWFDTHGEQAHFKSIRVVNRHTGQDRIMLGSANYTVRNLRGHNLESVVYLENARDIGRQLGELFDRAWYNQGRLDYSTDYETYSEDGLALRFKQIITFIANTTGLCTY